MRDGQRRYGDYETPGAGAADWGATLNENFGAVEADVRDLAARIQALEDGGGGGGGDLDDRRLFDPEDAWADMDWFPAGDLTVARVTNLDASGQGSLTDAANRQGPTLVVFETSGVIDLGGSELNLWEGQTYVAGQTAPSPGITIVGGTLELREDDTVVQHLRVRPGERQDYDRPSSVDAIRVGEEAQNVIVDHCTGSWSIDEGITGGIAGSSSEFPGTTTYSHNLMAEALDESVHPKGDHSKGMLLDQMDEAAVVGNVIAHCWDRNPKLADDTQGVVVNNYVYNFGYGFRPRTGDRKPTLVSMVGNVYDSGPDTPPADRQALIYDLNVSWNGDERFEIYFEDNELIPSDRPLTDFDDGDGYEIVDSPPVWPDGLDPVPASDLRDQLLPTVGARPADRTYHDRRVLDTVRNGGGRIIDSQDEVGGYPDLPENTRSLDPPEPGEGLVEWLHGHTRAVELPDADPPT